MNELVKAPSRRIALKGLICSGAVFADLIAAAQTPWGSGKSVRLVVHWPAGGPVDVPARYIAHVLSEQGLNTYVENRPGATGSVGAEFVYNAHPDGLTLLVATADALSLFPHLGPVRYDPLKFEPILSLGDLPQSIVTHIDSPFSTVSELIEVGKKRQLTYVTAGVGGVSHVATEEFARTTGLVRPLHVPAQGGTPAIIRSLIAKEVDFALTSPGVPLTMRDRLKIISMTGRNRLSIAPQVPTLKEAGIPLVFSSWMGIVGPPGLPLDVKRSIVSLISKIVTSSDYRSKLDAMAMDQALALPSDFEDLYRAEFIKWRDMVRNNNIKLG